MPLLTDEQAFYVEYSKRNCFEAMKNAVESLSQFRLESADSKTGVIQINCPASGYTWGELVAVNLLGDEKGTQVKISSTSKFPSALAKRKNVKNTQSIISKFSELISDYPKVHEVKPEQKTDDIKARLQKLKDLYGQSLITEDEYKTKKDEILKAI